MERAEKYLADLKKEKEYWQGRVDALPGDCIVTTHPFYRMCNEAAIKYAAAAYMYKLLTAEN